MISSPETNRAQTLAALFAEVAEVLGGLRLLTFTETFQDATGHLKIGEELTVIVHVKRDEDDGWLLQDITYPSLVRVEAAARVSRIAKERLLTKEGNG